MMHGFEFIQAILGASSFYRTAGLWGGSAILLLFLGVRVLFWRRAGHVPAYSSWRDDARGSASAVDFAITLPIFMGIMAMVIQLAAMANDAIVTHYAAYSAARSARVWMWDRDGDRRWPRQIPSSRTPAALVNRSQTVQHKIENAARFALIPASPVGAGGVSRQLPTTILKAMAKVSGQPARLGALSNKARYAFDPRNSTVEFDIARSALTQPGLSADHRQPSDAWAVTVSVDFRMHLGVPVASRLLGTRARSGGYYRTVSATVTLL